MEEFFSWFTRMENTKPFVLVLFFVTFVGIILYVYGGTRRKQRLESYKNIPLQDDADDANPKGTEQ
ncbi:MAG TPA: cbb3-type cytochrome c oxidase subunit 3 [Gammaproteobacteria bacterium]|nr:cbb3-type cytochrome c oxidase subunit 3 [Gammaproteobacteria bacterium]